MGKCPDKTLGLEEGGYHQHGDERPVGDILERIAFKCITGRHNEKVEDKMRKLWTWRSKMSQAWGLNT